MIDEIGNVSKFRSRQELKQEQISEQLKPTFEQITKLVTSAALQHLQTNNPELLKDENTARIAISAASAEFAQLFADTVNEQAIAAAGTPLALQDFLDRYFKE